MAHEAIIENSQLKQDPSLKSFNVANPRDIIFAQTTGTVYWYPLPDFTFKIFQGLNRFKPIREHVIPYYWTKISNRIFPIIYRANIGSKKCSGTSSIIIKAEKSSHCLWPKPPDDFEHLDS